MRFSRSTEDICIRKIEGGIRSLKNGSKSPSDLDLSGKFKMLKGLNEAMHDDLLGQYSKAVEVYKQKNS